MNKVEVSNELIVSDILLATSERIFFIKENLAQYLANNISNKWNISCSYIDEYEEYVSNNPNDAPDDDSDLQYWIEFDSEEDSTLFKLGWL